MVVVVVVVVVVVAVAVAAVVWCSDNSSSLTLAHPGSADLL